MNVFDLFAKLSLDSSNYEEGLSRAQQTASTAAKVGGAALVALGTAAVAGTKSLLDNTKAVAEYGDEVDKTSQKLGLSAEAYQKWDYVLNLAGTDMSSMTTGLKTLTNKIDDAKNGSSDAQEMFAKLGVSMDDLSTMSREQIFESTIYGFQQMADSTERAALANDLYGRSGQNLTPLFNQTSEQTKEQIALAEQYGMVMSDDMVKASARFQDSMTTAQKTVTGFKNAMLGELLPSFADVVDGFSALVSGSDESGEKLKEGIGNAVEAISEMLPRLFDIGGKIIMSIVDGIVDSLPQIVESAKKLVVELFNGLVSAIPKLLDMLPDLVDTVLDLIFEAIDAILQALPKIIKALAEAIPRIIKSLITKLMDNLPMIIQGLVDVVLAVAEALPTIIVGIIEALPDIIESVLTAVIECLPIIIEGLIELVLAIVEHLPEIIVALIDAIPTIIEKVATTIVKNFPRILEAIGTGLAKIVDKLGEWFGGLLGYIGEWLGEIWQGISDFFSNAWELGKQLVEGIWEGIKNGAISLWERITGWLKSIWDGICDFFDIDSPSKKMAWIGDMMLEGLAGSIKDKGHKALDAAKTLNEDLANAFDAEASIGFSDYADAGFNDGYGAYGDEYAEEMIVSRSGNDDRNMTVILELDGTQLARTIYRMNNEETQRVGLRLAGAFE